MVACTVPGMKSDSAGKASPLLQGRLDTLKDLMFALKHGHQNVPGRG